MFRHIRHLDAEFAAALVDEELAGLEDSQFVLVAGVEVGEDHIVLEELVEVAVEEQELVNQLDVGSLLFRFLVEGLDFGLLVVGEAGNVGIQFFDDVVPLSLVDGVYFGVVVGDGEVAHLGEGSLPGGVYALVEEEFELLVGASQGVAGDLVGAGGEVEFADSLDFLDRDVDGLRAFLVEGYEFAAHEVIRHFVFDCGDSLDGVVGLVAVGAVVDGSLDGVVLSLDLVFEGFLSRFHVVERNLVLLQVLSGEHALSRGDDGGAVLVLIVEVGESDMVDAVDDFVAVLDGTGEPFGGSNHFVDADFVVVIEVHLAESLLVEFQSFDGAAEDCP